MQYFFIFGNHPSLSAAEIISWLENAKYSYQIAAINQRFMVIDISQTLATDSLSRLGGCVKFGHVAHTIYEISTLAPWIEEWLTGLAGKESTGNVVAETSPVTGMTGQTSGKFYFGFSVYPQDNELSRKLYDLGLKIKKELKHHGQSARMVVARDQVLSSVVVQKNKLVSEQGVEVVVLIPKFKNKLDTDKDKQSLAASVTKDIMPAVNHGGQASASGVFVGKTIAVQPFENLGKRDFGRPSRDDVSGMLPPKLAQIMINLARIKPGEVVFDPFCGSGTIVQELLLMGRDRIIASDISEQAVLDTKKNLAWLAGQYHIQTDHVQIEQFDAAQLGAVRLPLIARIVTEPYLGPPARGVRTKQDIHKIVQELVSLYKKFLTNVYKHLSPQARIVMVWPMFFTQGQNIFLPFEQVVPARQYRLVEPLPKELMNTFVISKRNTVYYDRPGQSVRREIMILEKK